MRGEIDAKIVAHAAEQQVTVEKVISKCDGLQ